MFARSRSVCCSACTCQRRRQQCRQPRTSPSSPKRQRPCIARPQCPRSGWRQRYRRDHRCRPPDHPSRLPCRRSECPRIQPCPLPLPPVVPADPPPLPLAPPPPYSYPSVSLPPGPHGALDDVQIIFASARHSSPQPTTSTTKRHLTCRHVASTNLGHPSKPRWTPKQSELGHHFAACCFLLRTTLTAGTAGREAASPGTCNRSADENLFGSLPFAQWRSEEPGQVLPAQQFPAASPHLKHSRSFRLRHYRCTLCARPGTLVPHGHRAAFLVESTARFTGASSVSGAVGTRASALVIGATLVTAIARATAHARSTLAARTENQVVAAAAARPAATGPTLAVGRSAAGATAVARAGPARAVGALVVGI